MSSSLLAETPLRASCFFSLERSRNSLLVRRTSQRTILAVFLPFFRPGFSPVFPASLFSLSACVAAAIGSSPGGVADADIQISVTGSNRFRVQQRSIVRKDGRCLAASGGSGGASEYSKDLCLGQCSGTVHQGIEQLAHVNRPRAGLVLATVNAADFPGIDPFEVLAIRPCRQRQVVRFDGR